MRRGNNRKTKWRNWSLFLQCLDEFFGLFNLEAALQDRRRQTTLSTSIISQPRSSLFILYAIFFSPQKSECIFLRSLSNVHSHWGKHKAALAGKKKFQKIFFIDSAVPLLVSHSAPKLGRLWRDTWELHCLEKPAWSKYGEDCSTRQLPSCFIYYLCRFWVCVNKW